MATAPRLARRVLYDTDMTTNPKMRIHIAELASRFVCALTAACPETEEGVVMTTGPKPYRRIDCDGRALAYLRIRTRRAALRIDVSGLWVVPREHPMRTSTASGAATLYLFSEDDFEEAIAFLEHTISMTRAAHREEQRRLAELRAEAYG